MDDEFSGFFCKLCDEEITEGEIRVVNIDGETIVCEHCACWVECGRRAEVRDGKIIDAAS